MVLLAGIIGQYLLDQVYRAKRKIYCIAYQQANGTYKSG